MKPNFDKLLDTVSQMANSPVRNYIAPGLTSLLIGGKGYGMVRMFDSERNTREFITPHSHRFSFTCLVLEGSVTNCVFTGQLTGADDDMFCKGELRIKDGGMGEYQYIPGDDWSYWRETKTAYIVGDTYSMKASEIHSIQFSKNAKVLFFEGPEELSYSYALEPWADGKRVPTFGTAPWMFEKG